MALQGRLHQPVFQNHPPDQTSHDATGAEVTTEAPGPTPAARDATLPGPPGAVSRQTWETRAGEAAFPLDLERCVLMDWAPAASSKKWKRRNTFPGVGPVKEEEAPGRSVTRGLCTLTWTGFNVPPVRLGREDPGRSLSGTSAALSLTRRSR